MHRKESAVCADLSAKDCAFFSVYGAMAERHEAPWRFMAKLLLIAAQSSVQVYLKMTTKKERLSHEQKPVKTRKITWLRSHAASCP